MTQEEIAELLVNAERHYAKSEYDEAEALAEKVLISNSTSNEEVHALCLIGECYCRTGRINDSVSKFQMALVSAEVSSNLALQARALCGISFTQINHSEFNEALRSALHALSLSEGSNDMEQQIKALISCGDAYRILNHYGRSLEFLSRAYDLSEAIGNKNQIAISLQHIGATYRYFPDYPRALEHSQRALNLAEEICNRSTIANSLVTFGLVYMDLGDPGLALQYYERSLVITEQIRTSKIYINLSNIALVYEFIGDYQRAMDYHSRALMLAEEADDKHNIARILTCLGGASLGRGDYVSARDYFERSLQISELIGSGNLTCYTVNQIAWLDLKRRDLDAAYQGFAKSLRYRRDVLKSNQDVAWNLAYLAEVLIEQGKIEDALIRLQEALVLADNLGQKRVVSEVHKAIADVYSKMGDMPKAFEHLTKHLALDKEIFSEESRKKIELFNMRVEIVKREGETEVQRVRAESSERELSTSTAQLVAQTELLAEIRDSLTNVIRKIGPANPEVKELREMLKNMPCKAVDWERFDTQFKAAHPEFSKKLLEKYPKLTPTEVRMCSLLRMNMRSAEIARLFCLSERTVENHRYRIRTKMKIANSEDLIAILAKM